MLELLPAGLLCERPYSYVLKTADLSPGALVCAVLVFIFSSAHIYLWHHSHNRLWVSVGLISSIVGLTLSSMFFSIWRHSKKQPGSASRYAYLAALVIPAVFGLCVVFYFCWQFGSLLFTIEQPHFRTRSRTKQIIWRSLRAVLGAIGIAFQLLGFYGVDVGKHKLPPFVGSLLFHSLATFVFLRIFRRYAKLRQAKVVFIAFSFMVALGGDIAFLAIYHQLPSGCFDAYTRSHGPIYLVSGYYKDTALTNLEQVSCVREVLLLFLLLLVRLHTHFITKQLSDPEQGNSMNVSPSSLGGDPHKPPSCAFSSTPQISPKVSLHMTSDEARSVDSAKWFSGSYNA
ncbi:hypothetical protein PMIN04_011376 [Paraphaeosphaeria minitans]